MKKYLSDFLLIGGLLSLAIGLYIEVGIGISLSVCGSLIILFGLKLMPRAKE